MFPRQCTHSRTQFTHIILLSAISTCEVSENVDKKVQASGSSAFQCSRLVSLYLRAYAFYVNSILQPDYYKDAPHFRLVGAGPQYRLEIPYAKIDFTGTYSVIARNCYGEAKAVISLQIYARGKL